MASAPEGAAVDPVQAAINAAKQRADAMARSQADAAAQQALIDAAAQRAGTGSGPMFPNYKPYSPPSMTAPLVGAGAIGAGALALNSGSQQARPSGETVGVDETAQQAAIDAIRGREEFNQTAPNTFNQQEAIRIASARPEFNQSWSNRMPVQQDRARTTTQAQQRAPINLTSGQAVASPSIFSKIFGQPATTRQLFEQSQADPSDSGAWMRAERQYARTHKDDPNFDVTKLNEQGMKRGGAAKPNKDEAVHKALDIIQHLLMRH
jgi:hypothetical protein